MTHECKPRRKDVPNRLRVIFQLGDSQTKTIGMEKICLISAAIVLLVAQGEHLENHAFPACT